MSALFLLNYNTGMRWNQIIIFAVLAILLLGCRKPIDNYEEENSPFFAGEFAPTDYPFAGDLKIITWNIHFALEIDQAIKELQEVTDLQDADIILLQEMDELGTEEIAKTLEYNYIYYPASIHTKHDNNFGNAILSKWELSEPEKLILPHKNPTNDQIRIATKAVTIIDDLQITLYSVHIETAWLSGTKRNEQVDAIIEAIGNDDYVFVGGDFNSVTQANVTGLDNMFSEIDMIRVSEGAEPTVKVVGTGFSADHVFARNANLIENNVYAETEASDHFPVWAHVSLK